ncbi:MAG: lysophospholipid acyltransferase family protein [Candidatus Paceibacterota bacterium]
MNKHLKFFTPLFIQKIGYSLFFVLHKIFVGIEIEGKENLNGLTRPVILAANHTSELDPTAIPLVLPFFSNLFPLYFVTNPTEKYKTFGWRSYIYGGKFFECLGGYPVYSGNRDYAVSLEDHKLLLDLGRTVCIFPEGKRTEDGKLNLARGGLGYLIYATNAIVVPISINTFYNISFRYYLTRKKKVIIKVGIPMLKSQLFNTDNPNVEDFRGASQKVLDKIGEVMN